MYAGPATERVAEQLLREIQLGDALHVTGTLLETNTGVPARIIVGSLEVLVSAPLDVIGNPPLLELAEWRLPGKERAPRWWLRRREETTGREVDRQCICSVSLLESCAGILAVGFDFRRPSSAGADGYGPGLVAPPPTLTG
ncbi:hypothetical protein [Streptomyces sp. NPDC055140]